MKMVSVNLPESCSAERFREVARRCLGQNIEAERLVFVAGDVLSMFDQLPESETGQEQAISVPRRFHELVSDILCHAASDRFALLYRLLWRIHHGERHLLDRATDPDVIRASRYAKAIDRDVHRMHAFVRFSERQVEGKSMFVAWFEPEHRVLERAAPFFVDRFTNMDWIIATPFGTAIWKDCSLAFAPPGPRPAAANDPVLDDFWTTFYRVTFNPARLRIGAMRAQMPKRHWPTMPETRSVPSLVQSAGTRVDAMAEQVPELPPKYALALERRPLGPQNVAPVDNLDVIRREAQTCTRCPLYGPATQLVFGEGAMDASIMFVGEQPGDQEDLAGRPFVGPAGQVFDRALAATEIARKDVYVTNAVKHFKFEPRGKRRIHSKPGYTEVLSCRHWLDRELAAVRPKLVVALGATAARCLAGRVVAVTKERGRVHQFGDLSVLVTIHPSYVLRITDTDAAKREYENFVLDLKLAKQWLDQQSCSEVPRLFQAS